MMVTPFHFSLSSEIWVFLFSTRFLHSSYIFFLTYFVFSMIPVVVMCSPTFLMPIPFFLTFFPNLFTTSKIFCLLVIFLPWLILVLSAIIPTLMRASLLGLGCQPCFWTRVGPTCSTFFASKQICYFVLRVFVGDVM